MEEITQQDILVDIEPQLVQAGSGKRLANYFIDLILFYILFFILGMIIAMVSPESLENDALFSDNVFLDRLFSLLIFGVYMSLVEGIFKGRTLGKLITGTKAVNADGSTISFVTALGRGFSRIVPFEPFSALGNPPYPWHDKWTNTYVIDVRESRLES
jgi:uncharacterized RDD family membrane protein YckC